MATIVSERPSAHHTRPAFEVFVAVLAAAALVAGMYAPGRAAADGA